MASLLLTLSPDEPLVIGDAETVINVISTQGKYVRVRVDADKKTEVNRGSIYIRKKLIPKLDYINTPIKDLWSENPELMDELLEQTANGLRLENFNFEQLSGKAKRIFSMISPKFYGKIIELFLAKFLYANNLEFNTESVKLFKNDFLGDNNLNENTTSTLMKTTREQ